MKIGISLSEEEEHKLVDQLNRNIDLFAWAHSDMLGIDIRVLCHRLSVNPSVRLVLQRKLIVGEEKRVAIDEEVDKLASVNFITETKYPT